jgi:hypothetical protein
MIEIKETDGKPNLFIDGDKVETVSSPSQEGERMRLGLVNSESVNKLLPRRVSDFPVSEITITLALGHGFLDFWGTTKINTHLGISYENNTYTLSVQVMPSVSDWNRLWTFREYHEELKQIFQSNEIDLSGINFIEVGDEHSIFSLFPMLNFSIDVTSPENTTLKDEVNSFVSILQKVHEKIEKSLSARLRADSVVMYFDFPDEVRVTCEQYLLYFIQFLRDLGVSASAELTHELGRVLFSVTPEDSNDALDKIRLALEIFLKLPTGSVNDSSALAGGIEIQRLIANIQHLKGQMALAAAVIQAKDATIEAMQITIEQQRHLLNGEVIYESLRASSEPVPTEDKEMLMDGLIAITKYKGKGFEIDLPDLIRRLKQLFRQE